MSVEIYREDPSVGAPYRKGYLRSVQAYLQTLRDGAEAKRRGFITPESLARDREGYRRTYYEMLGAPLTELETYRNIPVECLENTPVTVIPSDGEGRISLSSSCAKRTASASFTETGFRDPRRADSE